jgi:hypothetical protein
MHHVAVIIQVTEDVVQKDGSQKRVHSPCTDWCIVKENATNPRKVRNFLHGIRIDVCHNISVWPVEATRVNDCEGM